MVARKPSGRTQKLSIRDKRDLARILTHNRHLSLGGIIEQMRVKVCKRTLSTYIKRLGFGNRLAARKPYLSQKHKADRLAFAKAHKRWTLSDWRNIMWTDESSFEIGKRSRQVKVWRRAYERYSLDCIAPTFKSGRTSVMIWGAFSGFDKCPIVVMPLHKRTSEDFVDIVYEGRLSGFYFMHNERENLILMEDGAPVHRSKYAESWRMAHGIKKLKWPANSPDLNPIENLWKIVKDSVQNGPIPQNQEELIKSIERAWEGIYEEIIEILIASMPQRMRAVIDVVGGSIR